MSRVWVSVFRCTSRTTANRNSETTARAAFQGTCSAVRLARQRIETFTLVGFSLLFGWGSAVRLARQRIETAVQVAPSSCCWISTFRCTSRTTANRNLVGRTSSRRQRSAVRLARQRIETLFAHHVLPSGCSRSAVRLARQRIETRRRRGCRRGGRRSAVRLARQRIETSIRVAGWMPDRRSAVRLARQRIETPD